ncbi:hypothetical protein FA13DRAFT_112110 [Coprinellus micaceus]|uniref:Uncharacterized protein n=1 Tax=Coprinellus micaceus TaxID=71717 RepID=A0A4Y7TIM0_COPMI|nr:hypothetical protein FA13DRAFT_112110 [Coprinellus micaceus]
MSPSGWATPLELEFLASLIPEYEACQVKRRYKDFWHRLNTDFLAKFPVVDKIFPGKRVTELNAWQKELHAAAIVKQKQRLKEWFRWRMNPRSRNASAATSKKNHTSYKGRTRNHKPYEVFAKIYQEEVEKAKVALCEVEGVSGRERLIVWQRVSKELYDSASDEKKRAVQQAIEVEEQWHRDNAAAMTPTQYPRFRKQLPIVLDAARPLTPVVVPVTDTESPESTSSPTSQGVRAPSPRGRSPTPPAPSHSSATEALASHAAISATKASSALLPTQRSVPNAGTWRTVRIDLRVEK